MAAARRYELRATGCELQLASCNSRVTRRLLQADEMAAARRGAAAEEGSAAEKLLKLAAAMLARERPKMEGEKQLLLHLAALERLQDSDGALALLAEKGELMREPEARLREEASPPAACSLQLVTCSA